MNADVYDVDARGRKAPDQLGVLSHYRGVIWYSGDDIVTRKAGWAGGNADRLALDEMLEFRAYMDEGGKVFYTGNRAGQQYAGNLGQQLYDPKGEGPCQGNASYDARRCLPLQGSGDGTNDVLQYYFGGYLSVANDGLDESGNTFDIVGTDSPFTGLGWGFGGPESADNQNATSSFIATSGILPKSQFPQFASHVSSRWDKPGGPFAPHTGDHYVYSGIADVAYKRLTREIAVPTDGDHRLSFWTSYDTEEAWDFLTVEARTAGGDDWTTLPDLQGHTSNGTGDSCPEGWRELHPQLDHYQTIDESTGTCSSVGSTGSWHAASGNSGGWQRWELDLSAWAGRTVEVSIASITDWGTHNLGVFLDDIVLPDGSTTSFEDGLDGWTVSGPPPGSGPNANDWTRTDATGFPVGATITTPRSLLAGFGFEGIATPAERNAVMGRVLTQLLG